MAHIHHEDYGWLFMDWISGEGSKILVKKKKKGSTLVMISVSTILVPKSSLNYTVYLMVICNRTPKKKKKTNHIVSRTTLLAAIFLGSSCPDTSLIVQGPPWAPKQLV
jgi:hypothetical protein